MKTENPPSETIHTLVIPGRVRRLNEGTPQNFRQQGKYKKGKTEDGGKWKNPAEVSLFYLCCTPKYENP